MKSFIARGSFTKKDKRQNFEVAIDAPDEGAADTKVICQIGSRYQCPRRFITVKIEEAK